MSKLLVVDDEESICWGIARLGRAEGHEVITASSAEEALELVGTTVPDVIVLDVRLPGLDGLSAIDHFRRLLGAVPIIVMTAYGDLQTAVEAVNKGAFDYLIKPFDLDQVQRVLVRALVREQGEEVTADPQAHVGGMVGSSPAMQEVFKQIALAASSEVNVLLSGESGTGKELAARAIHRFSRRSDCPFVAVNMASLSPSLAESELFGHVRGSFTGAEENRQGLLALADGGTLFLDEVADIPLPLQIKLLRVLEQGEVVPVGANQPIHSSFRLVSATHQDLLQKIQRGEFRHDLYYRLCAFRIDMPPLRNRAEDLGALAEYFVAKLSTAGGARRRLSASFREELQHRPWHGNVRELRNAVEHAIILSRGGVLIPEHLPPPVSAAPTERPTDNRQQIAVLVSDWAASRLSDGSQTEELHNELLEIVEPPLLEETLKQSKGQYVAAARRLGLHRTTLKKKLGQYGMDHPGSDS